MLLTCRESHGNVSLNRDIMILKFHKSLTKC